ncbi:MAG: S41 family peptidase [Thermoanaerobaculia bacterium]|nr:S41 family peptidase [Thermoanaerobaculia bacterium]
MTTKKAMFLLVSVVAMLSLLAAGVLGQSLQKDNVYRHLSVFTEVLSIVNGNYVEEVSSDELLDGAFAGVTQAVDEFSFYVPPAEMAAFRKSSERGDLLDAGVLLSKRFGYAFVIAVRDGSPAAKAGLGPGDFIEKIGGKPTEKMGAWQVEAALRGAKDEKRAITVVHGGITKREEMTIVLAPPSPAEFVTKDFEGTPYLKIPEFGPSTAAALEQFLAGARKQAKPTVLIDVRGNSGDDVESAVKCADMLLTKGMITSVVGRRVPAKSWSADRATLYDGDVLVLVDQSTVGAAEVFSSAISGNGRGRTVGLPSYGRAIVQKTVDLPSGGGLRVTIAHYSTPDLKPIKELGVKPDVALDRALPEPDKTAESDPILEKALSLLEQKTEKAAA